MNKKLFEFHLYLRLSPKIAQMLFDWFNLSFEPEGGSYYMAVPEDKVGSFDEAFNQRKDGEAGIIP